MRSLVRYSILAVSIASVLSLGCGGGGGGGGGASCSDACNHLFTCAGSLNAHPADFLGSDYATVSTCINHCNAGTCPRQQQLLDCAVGIQCNNVSQVAADAEACFTNAQCEP